MGGQIEMSAAEFRRLYGGGEGPPEPPGGPKVDRRLAKVLKTPARPFYPRLRAAHGALIVMAFLGWTLQIPAMFNLPGILLFLILGYDVHQIRVSMQETWSAVDRVYRHLRKEEDEDE